MKSFLEGRQVVSRNGGLVDRAISQLPSFGQPQEDSTVPMLVGYSPEPQREHGEKTIETVEVDGVIQKIIVTCGCGEKIEVHCGY